MFQRLGVLWGFFFFSFPLFFFSVLNFDWLCSDDNAGDAKAAVESDEEEADFSFNFNSESSDEEIKFPTSAALLIPSIEISDPFVDLDTSTKRVAKDFIGSDA